MSLEQKRTDELNKLIKLSLDNAERIWARSETLLMLNEEIRIAAKAIASEIPGYPLVDPIDSQVDLFIAMVVDMRDSSKHLLEAISGRVTRVNQLQRVFYETSALLPASAKAISYEQGRVTEYLGDGVLALFLVQERKIDKAIYAAHRAAQSCVAEVRDLVNQQLSSRYNLPEIDIGVGLSMSKAIVTLVGTTQYQQPKVIGECVYRATKLSGGKNEITVDDSIKHRWPTSPDGTVRFRQRQLRGVNGHVVERKA